MDVGRAVDTKSKTKRIDSPYIAILLNVCIICRFSAMKATSLVYYILPLRHANFFKKRMPSLVFRQRLSCTLVTSTSCRIIKPAMTSYMPSSHLNPQTNSRNTTKTKGKASQPHSENKRTPTKAKAHTHNNHTISHCFLRTNNNIKQFFF